MAEQGPPCAQQPIASRALKRPTSIRCLRRCFQHCGLQACSYLVVARASECNCRVEYQTTATSTQLYRTHKKTLQQVCHKECSQVVSLYLALRSGGTPSPKKTTSGLRMPPQRGQGGTTKPLPASCSSTSPSGRRTGISTSPSGRRTKALPCAFAIHSPFCLIFTTFLSHLPPQQLGTPTAFCQP
jgi:hypothetical protein